MHWSWWTLEDQRQIARMESDRWKKTGLPLLVEECDEDEPAMRIDFLTRVEKAVAAAAGETIQQ